MQEKPPNDQAHDHFRTNTQKVLFIRHGESETLIGKAATHTEEIRLTQNGRRQAREIAQRFLTAPDLIITSPYLRAWETASPTLQRFAATPHQIWPAVQEFTYLGSLAGVLSTKQQRLVLVNNYWDRCDPAYEEGGSGESFSQLIQRAEEVLDTLRREKGFIVVFTHEQFIRIIQCVLRKETESTPEYMKHFHTLLKQDPLDYGAIWELPLFPVTPHGQTQSSPFATSLSSISLVREPAMEPWGS